jgi:hypothetical protein
MDADDVKRVVAEDATKSTQVCLSRCIASKWEISFVQTWKQTLRNHSRRYSRIVKINEWFASVQGDVDFVVPAFWAEAAKIIEGGAPTKK